MSYKILQRHKESRTRYSISTGTLLPLQSEKFCEVNESLKRTESAAKLRCILCRVCRVRAVKFEKKKMITTFTVRQVQRANKKSIHRFHLEHTLRGQKSKRFRAAHFLFWIISGSVTTNKKLGLASPGTARSFIKIIIEFFLMPFF